MKKLVVLTGAGVSAESGISTFRDSDGLWERYPVEQVASHEGWLTNPTLVTEFYNERRKQLVTCRPNKAHLLLAELEKYFDVTVVTQNVDNLHEQAGSSKVIHLHGELMKVCSSKDPDDERYIQTLTSDNVTVKPGTRAGDGSLLRPFIVFFGESVPKISEAAEITMVADVFVVIGTSLNVYPAAGLLNYVNPRVPIYVIDPKEVPVSSTRVKMFRTIASEGMELLWKELVGE